MFGCHHCGRTFGTQLDRIEHKLDGLIHITERQGRTMSELDDKLTNIEAAETALEADEQRELADLQALKANPSNTLSPEQEQRLDSLLTRVQAADAAINDADPAPVVTPPTDGGDGGQPVDGQPVDGGTDPGTGDGSVPVDTGADGTADGDPSATPTE